MSLPLAALVFVSSAAPVTAGRASDRPHDLPRPLRDHRRRLRRKERRTGPAARRRFFDCGLAQRRWRRDSSPRRRVHQRRRLLLREGDRPLVLPARQGLRPVRRGARRVPSGGLVDQRQGYVHDLLRRPRGDRPDQARRRQVRRRCLPRPRRALRRLRRWPLPCVGRREPVQLPRRLRPSAVSPPTVPASRPDSPRCASTA